MVKIQNFFYVNTDSIIVYVKTDAIFKDIVDDVKT